MDIYEMIKGLSRKKQIYARWRFGLEYNNKREKHSEERLCEILGVKTLSEYGKWEKSDTFLKLMNAYLQTMFANDLEDVYNAVTAKAKEGDVQSVKLMLQLQKEIKKYNTIAKEIKTKDEPLYDLELD